MYENSYTNQNQHTNKQDIKSANHKELLSTLAIIIIAPLIAIFLTMFVFQSYEVEGPSMQDTLHDNDRLLVSKTQRTWARITGKNYIPNRYDIVIFDHSDNYNGPTSEKQLIKRVIALPGERVVIRGGIVRVYNQDNPNGFEVDQAGPEAKTIGYTSGNMEFTISENRVFLLGDNRPNSLDSRVFGPIEAKHIVGKLSVRIYPFSQFDKF